MTSYGDVQYPQNPFLVPVSNYNYDDVSLSRGGNFYRPHSHPMMPVHDDPYTSSGSSGYGDSAPSGYGTQHYPDHPTGPSGTGYANPVTHAPPPTKETGFSGFKKGGTSAMSALTLLSFFFFVNLLQSCIKEHMDTMNPTVMVMTNNVVRNRYDPSISEMNSREQSTSAASNINGEHIVIEPDDLVAAAAASSSATASAPLATIAATLTVVPNVRPTPGSVQIINGNEGMSLYSTPETPEISQPNLNPYVSNYNYPNRSEILRPTFEFSDRYRPQDYHDDYYNNRPHRDEGYPWSHKRHSYYGQDSHRSGGYMDPYDDRRFPNHDSYDDVPYMRIY